MSYRILLADLAALYDGREPPALGYTYREYRQAIEAEETLPQPVRDADRDWWAQRIPQLPDPPALPTRAGGERDRRRSTRRWHWLDPQTRDALFARARARGITPAMTLAAAFANVLARWSASSRFLLNLPLFSRQALHPDVDLLVGDFTSSLLLDVDLTGARTAAARAQAVQEALRSAANTVHTPGCLCCVTSAATVAPRCWHRWYSPARWGSATFSARTSPSNSAHPDGSFRRGPRCCSTPRSPSSTAVCW